MLGTKPIIKYWIQFCTCITVMVIHQNNNIPPGEHVEHNTRQSINYDDFNDSTATIIKMILFHFTWWLWVNKLISKFCDLKQNFVNESIMMWSLHGSNTKTTHTILSWTNQNFVVKNQIHKPVLRTTLINFVCSDNFCTIILFY